MNKNTGDANTSLDHCWEKHQTVAGVCDPEIVKRRFYYMGQFANANKMVQLLSIVAIASLAGCFQETIDDRKLLGIPDKYSKTNSETPFFGISVEHYLTGLKWNEGTFKDGKAIN